MSHGKPACVLKSISLLCRRFNEIVPTQEFQDKMYVEWLKRVIDWSKTDKAYREKYLYSRTSAVHLVLCKYCDSEFPAASGWHRHPVGSYAFYDDEDDYCSNECRESAREERQ